MTSPLKFFQFKNTTSARLPRPWGRTETLRYWLSWALVIAALGLLLDRYLDYRDRELDRRIEQLKI